MKQISSVHLKSFVIVLLLILISFLGNYFFIEADLIPYRVNVYLDPLWGFVFVFLWLPIILLSEWLNSIAIWLGEMLTGEIFTFKSYFAFFLFYFLLVELIFITRRKLGYKKALFIFIPAGVLYLTVVIFFFNLFSNWE